jgi:hypothetical protein
MNNTLKFILICTTTLLMCYKTTAQNNYIEINKSLKKVNPTVISKIQSLGFTANFDYYINNYLLVKKDNYRSLSDTLGNVINLPIKNNFVFYPTKKGIIFTADESKNIHSHSEKLYNIQSFNVKGEENKIQINNLSSYFFSFRVGQIPRQYFTDFGDYITIHKAVDNVIFEGLLQDNGKLVLEAEYQSIDHIGKNFFSLKKDGFYYIFDAVKKTINPTKFEEIQIYEINFENYFYGKNIAKKDNKYGLYDFTLNKWAITNVYDKLEQIIESFGLDQRTPKARHIKVMYTDLYIAEKDKKTGAINQQNQVIVPLLYSKISYSKDGRNPNYFTVYNDLNQYNYYDLTSKKELFKSFYSEMNFDDKKRDVVFGKAGKYWKMFNSFTDEVYLDETEKMVNITFGNFGPCFYIEFEDGTKGLGSHETKKIIVNKERDIYKVNDSNSYFTVSTSTYKNYIIDSKGNILVPPLKQFNGAVKLLKEHFVVYNFNKPDKILMVFNKQGEEIDKKEFLAK